MIIFSKPFVYLLFGILVVWVLTYIYLEFIHKPNLIKGIEDELFKIQTGNEELDRKIIDYYMRNKR